MAIQLSVTLRNNKAGQLETTVGTTGVLEVRSGAVPANCAAADSGTLLASITLPADWLTAASNGAVSINGTWQDASADATGTAAHFRIKTGATCHLQGTCSASGGGGDMILNSTSLVAGGTFSVTSFTLTEGNA